MIKTDKISVKYTLVHTINKGISNYCYHDLSQANFAKMLLLTT